MLVLKKQQELFLASLLVLDVALDLLLAIPSLLYWRSSRKQSSPSWELGGGVYTLHNLAKVKSRFGRSLGVASRVSLVQRPCP